MNWLEATRWGGRGCAVTPLRLSDEDIRERFKGAGTGPTVAELIRDGYLSGIDAGKEEAKV